LVVFPADQHDRWYAQRWPLGADPLDAFIAESNCKDKGLTARCRGGSPNIDSDLTYDLIGFAADAR